MLQNPRISVVVAATSSKRWTGTRVLQAWLKIAQLFLFYSFTTTKPDELRESNTMVLDSPVSVRDDTFVWSVRAFYVFAAYAIVIVRFIPDLKTRFLNYGARSPTSEMATTTKETALPKWLRVQIDPILDWAADLTVPHSWFTHFYVTSTICSAYWMFYHRRVFGSMFSTTNKYALITSLEGRTIIALVLLQFQGLRRLYECIVIAKKSQSRMWIGHYAIGIAFYLATDIAIWVEPSVRETRPTIVSDLTIVNLARTVACVFTFLYYSKQQHVVHRYLASLKGYQVPNHQIFQTSNLVCPHYAFEIYIYITLTILTARDERVLNVTMLCATAFVVINLGVTADMTKRWQLKTFPKQRPEIAGRNRMLSFW